MGIRVRNDALYSIAHHDHEARDPIETLDIACMPFYKKDLHYKKRKHAAERKEQELQEQDIVECSWVPDVIRNLHLLPNQSFNYYLGNTNLRLFCNDS